MKNKRIFLPNIITPEEAKVLRDTPHLNTKESLEIIDEVKRVVDRTLYHINWKSPSIIRVEQKPNGHPWHVDTGGDYGSEGHMMWCDYGCSILLNDKDTSGFLEYRDGTKILPKEHYCSLAMHSSDVEHRAYTDGTRETLLCFVQRKL